MREPDPGLIDHTIQKEIVRTLVQKSQAKYSELKPSRVEANLFMYHVNQLIKRGVIDKNNGIYKLTTLGDMYVDRANLDKLVFRVQPKIVTILAVKSSKGNWLLLKRNHEPHMGRVGFPSGKLHYGETLEASANRELKEKTGIVNVELKLAGNVAMRFLDKTGSETINHTLGYVFTAVMDVEKPVTSSSQYWQAYWGPEAELITGNVFKGHKEILSAMSAGKPFISSFDFTSDY